MLWIAAMPLAAAERHILFIAGPSSHGAGAHEHEAGSRVLADHLESSGLGVTTEVVVGWPEDAAKVAAADSIVIYSDGLESHVAAGHHEAILSRVVAGKGHAVIHFAVEPGEENLTQALQAAIGGHFEVDWSVNPMWDLKSPILPEHAVTQGVEPFEVRDEFYYHMRFREDVTPVLQAHPPADTLGAEDGPRSGNPAVRAALDAEMPQTLAWVVENPSGSRGFGFTGGHYHALWANDDYRQLVVNAIAWTAGVEVPEDGVPGEIVSEPVHPTIDVAIARNDLEDVKRHLAANPDLLDTGAASRPPLPHAILRNHNEIASHLIAAGANLDVTDNADRTPLHLAVDRNNPEIITTLLAAGANPRLRDRTGWTPLHHAAARDRVAVARALLDGGADLTTLSEGGGTPLHEAAASGGEEMIKLILDRGVDVDIRSKTDVTALDIAREFENEAAIRLLE